jgi:hypothetical protein
MFPMRYAGRRVVSLVAVASFLPSLVLAATVAGDPWIRFAPQAELFEVDLPGTPERRVGEKSTVIGKIEDISYRVQQDDETYLVTRVELPGFVKLFWPLDRLLQNIRDGFLENGNGTETSYSDIERDGYAGKRLDFIRHEARGAQSARAEFFVIDGKMLSFTAIIPQGRSMDGPDRFLSTIELAVAD